MGHDVDAIGNHKLRTDNIVNLAEDLAKRFNSRVKYGYINNENPDDDFNFKELGAFGKGSPIYCIQDMYHFERIKEPDKHVNTICFEIFLENSFDEYNTYIFRDAFLADIYYYNRWWGFCRVFTREYEYVYDSYVSDFRKEVHRQTNIFGGDMAIYFDDQANGNNNTFHLEEIGFNEFKSNLLRDGSVLDISSWFESDMPALKDYPLAFIDDFKSLDSIIR